MTYKTVAIASGNNAHVWEPTSNASSSSRPSNGTVDVNHPDGCNSVAWTRNGKAFVSSGGDGRIALHRSNGQSMGTLPHPGEAASLMGQVDCLGFNRGSKLLAAGYRDGSVHVWSLQQQKRILKLTDHVDTVTAVAFSPDGHTLASSSVSGELLLHTAEGLKTAKLQSQNLAPITCLTFAQSAGQNPVLACCTKAGALQLWSLLDRRSVDNYPKLHKGAAAAVRFADGKGNILLSAGADGSVVLIDRRLDGVAACARTGSLLSALDVHHEGHTLAVGTAGGSVLLYDVRNLGGKSLNRLDLPSQRRVTEVQWQPPEPSAASYQQRPAGRLNISRAPTQPQAFARKNGRTAPFTPLDNHTLTPGASLLESLSTPSFLPKAYDRPQNIQEPPPQPSRLSQMSDQAEKLAVLQSNAVQGSEAGVQVALDLAAPASSRGLPDTPDLFMRGSRRPLSASTTDTVASQPDEAASAAGHKTEVQPSISAPQMPAAPTLAPVPSTTTSDLAIELRGDMTRLHMEIVRQLHLQQVEFLGMMEAISHRQEALEGRIHGLVTQVKKFLQMKESMLLM